jgi:hypothetical protein
MTTPENTPKSSWTPAECAHCGYEVVPAEVGHEIHGSHWEEPSPNGWVHNPATVGKHWTENYDTKTHAAMPYDGRTVEQEHAGAEEFQRQLDATHTKAAFEQIMKNNNLGRQFD